MKRNLEIIETETRKKYIPPLFDLLISRDIVNHVFSFIPFGYYSILQLVDTNWFFYFDISDKSPDLMRFNKKKTMIAEIIKSNEINLLKWLYNNFLSSSRLMWLICRLSARNGKIDILKWARENGCPWNEDICSDAASNGHLDCLKWARENGCPWDEYTCSEAAKTGHLDCLKWARKNGCPWYGAIRSVCNKILNYGCWYECDRCRGIICNDNSQCGSQCGNQCGMCGDVLCHKCEKITNCVMCETCGNLLDCCSECIKDNLTTCVRC